MPLTSQQRALDVLEASLGLPDAERLRLFEVASAADPAVAAELHRLESVRTRAPFLLATDVGVGDDIAPTPPPEHIGVYRLTHLIGRGGMGAVYEGVRTDGLFDQRVAIKLLASRRWTTELERRFVTERRVLARLEHRNIARIYDGGVSADGHSYIVMEHIDGQPITEFARTHSLDLRARVTLVLQLCSALQFAHQQLVVHADVKPSNVLVAADGSVKLLDFGIAQLLGSDETPPASSGVGSREPLTAAYAAPERKAGGPATVASDVYSLGIVLRDLLPDAGIKPAAGADLRAAIDKATAESPADRYATVGALANDLSRWLRRLPMNAVRQSWRYTTSLFVARNRTAVTLAGIATLGLIAATIISTRSYFVAERARAEATARFDEMLGLTSYLVGGLSEQMLERPGMLDAHSQTMEEARGRLEQLAASKPNDARLQIELGRDLLQIALNSLATAPSERNNTTQVRRNLAAAGERLARLSGVAAELPGYWELRAEIMALQGNTAMIVDGKAKASVGDNNLALGLADEALRRRPESLDARTAHLSASMSLANSLNAEGRQLEAIQTLDKALSATSKLSTDALLAAPRLLNATISAEFYRCDFKRWQFADESALRDCTAVEARLRELIARQGPLVSLETKLAYTLFLTATMLPQPSASTRSLARLEEARTIMSRILHFGPNATLEGQLLVVDSARAATLSQLHRDVEAQQVAQQLLAARRVRLAAQPDSHERQREVATALRRVGEVAQGAGNPREACRAFAEAGAIWDDMQARGTLLGFDLAPKSGQVPWIRRQLNICKGS